MNNGTRNLKRQPEQQAHVTAVAQTTPLIEVENVTKQFLHLGTPISVLRGIDLTIHSGETVAIVGKSGVGKSTLLHILGTIDHPSEGKVRYNGEDVFSMPERRLARFRNKTIGFIFQFHYLLPEFSALENVLMPTLINRMDQTLARKIAQELLDTVGLSQRMNHKPAELSGGEQQRVALARALVMRPKAVLADEPTGNLDERTSTEMHDLFLKLNHEFGVTLVIVTHNARLADKLPRKLVMHDGLVYDASDNNHEQVLN